MGGPLASSGPTAAAGSAAVGGCYSHPARTPPRAVRRSEAPLPENAPASAIEIRGARQHNLKNLDLDLPRGRLSVITGVSGSGKSSLAFDTLYAEGQRRYVESVSTYARQFLDRLPRPDVDTIHGLMPAVAIRQSAPARSGRSTVGTATEVSDYLRVLFSRLGQVSCLECGRPVRADSPAGIVRESAGWPEGDALLVLAAVRLAKSLGWEEQAGHLLAAGYTRVVLSGEVRPLDPLPKLKRGTAEVRVVVDRFTWRRGEEARLAEACEQAFRRGEGRLELWRGEGPPERRSELWECSHCGAAALRPEPALFSFNSPLGVCPACRGFGDVLTFTVDRIVPDPSKSLREGALKPWAGSWRRLAWPRIEKFARERGIALDEPWDRLEPGHRRLLLEGGEGFRGVIPFLERRKEKSYKAGNRFLVKAYQTALPCADCGGTRLRREARAVRLGGQDIAAVSALTISAAARWLAGLEFTPAERGVAGPVLAEVESRLRFLERVDLGYLTLDRATRTLSGGEAQRIELANALGANLTETLYVLDEPTVGLHPRDTERLVAILRDLADRGNTVVVVEHEPLVMRAADHVVDLGPGAGELGGCLLYAGPGGAALAGVATDTARYLRGEKRVERVRRPGVPRDFVAVLGATHHNLKGVDARFPLGRLTAVSGVSGSGKSSLVEDVLHRAARLALEGAGDEPPGTHRAVTGLERLKRVALVDQSPIGRTPRSCPVTYLGAFAALREVYARQPAALARGLRDGAFSFNTAGRALRGLRGRRLGHGRDVLPRRPAGALRHLRRGPLPPRGARGALPRGERARRPRPDRGPGLRALRRRAALHPGAAHPATRGARLPPARAAGDPALRAARRSGSRSPASCRSAAGGRPSTCWTSRPWGSTTRTCSACSRSSTT